MITFRMIMIWAVIGLASISTVQASDMVNSVLRLGNARMADGRLTVAVQVINDRPLAGMDIPLRFGAAGDPIDLVDVKFTDRVAGWDFTYARIDNERKTVILGLISELMGTRPNASLDVAAEGHATVAELVFEVGKGYTPKFDAFTTTAPGHDLTFIYTDMRNGEGPFVHDLSPQFEVDASLKGAIAPATFALSENYPNPFNPSTSFALTLPSASDYAIRIYNVAGQVVRSIGGRMEAGTHTIVWDGRSDQGTKVASGVYFMKAQAGTFSATRKMTLLK